MKNHSDTHYRIYQLRLSQTHLAHFTEDIGLQVPAVLRATHAQSVPEAAEGEGRLVLPQQVHGAQAVVTLEQHRIVFHLSIYTAGKIHNLAMLRHLIHQVLSQEIMLLVTQCHKKKNRL